MSEPAAPPSELIKLITCLKNAETDWDAENIADLLWLARHIEGERSRPLPSSSHLSLPPPLSRQIDNSFAPPPPPPPEAGIGLYSEESQSQTQKTSPDKGGIPFQVPTAPTLRKTLAIGRALRPLMHRVDSYTQQVLDEEATAEQTAEQQFCMTVVQPAQERWLEVALVVEDSAASFLWRETIRDFKQVLERQGAFRAVTVWYLQTSDGIKLLAKPPERVPQQSSRSPKELIDASGRRLILLVSDCISVAWRTGALHRTCLELWAAHSPLAIVQLLPGYLWSRTVLSAALEVQLGAWMRGATNRQLLFQAPPLGSNQEQSSGLKIPVITLEPSSLAQWAKMVAGWGESWAAGVWFDEGWQNLHPCQTSIPDALTAEQLVQRFITTASALARRLAGLMALVPVNLPIIYLLQETSLRESTPLHLAEVFMSGLIERRDEVTEAENSTRKQQPVYDFVPDVRELLIDSVPTPLKADVLDRVSQYIGAKLNRSIYSFTALLQLEKELGEAGGSDLLKFANVAKQVLRRMGGDYAALVDGLERSTTSGLTANTPDFEIPLLRDIPFTLARLIDDAEETAESDSEVIELQMDTFQLATLTVEPEMDSGLELFEFKIATLERQDVNRLERLFRRSAKWVIKERQGQARRFIERLNGQVGRSELGLEMVFVAGGSFMMGSPLDEPEQFESEGPQHEVSVQSFFIGRYPVTQAQWRFVAGLETVDRELDPDPSSFKGDDRPVEKVSWYDAVEFCDRLSRYTQSEYRLPTEAEWEYACRAGTQTPFHFGETISAELANYIGSSTYNNGPKGEHRQETTPVDHFDVANTWGLSDMHGNVWEWCLDHWHDSYEGVSEDARAWSTEDESSARVIRGGSWNLNPGNCRSASRDFINPVNRLNSVGFRVVCRAPRPLQQETD